MSKYLVTGGCGFIGSHLVDRLLSEGHKVVVIDNLSTGKRENLAKEAQLIMGDICDQPLLENTLEDVDGCFHLAAQLGMVSCKEDWLGTHHINLTGTIIVFNALRMIKERLKKSIPVVYTSSCAVYGDSKHLPLSESQWISPISSYGADKLGCEQHGRVAHDVYGIPAIGLRLFNIYGPRQTSDSVDSGVIPIYIDQAMKGKPLAVFGDGEQTRDFVHVSDVVNAFIFFMKNNQLAPNVYNVCTGHTTTVNEVIDLMEKFMGRKIERQYLAPRTGDVEHSCGDVHKSESLGLKPKIKFAGGLEALLSLFEE